MTDNIIKLPGLNERFWRVVIPAARAAFIARNARPGAIDWALEDLQRRFDKIHVVMAVANDLREDPKVIELLQHIYGGLIDKMIELELELWSARHPHP
jgi:hypothetical protein